MKMFKYFFLIFCLTASLYAADWTGATSEPKSTKEIDGKTFYVITSAEELAWFAAQVNSGKMTINAQLANDIHFMGDTSKTSSVNWTPIGEDSSAIFNGIFDGSGKTICGLYSNQDKFAGIFGVTGKDAVIKSVKSIKSSIYGEKSGTYAGIIVAFNWGLVMGCTGGGNRMFAGDSAYFGGIVGWNAGTIRDCANNGSLNITVSTSFIAPFTSPELFPEDSVFFYSYFGGIAGWNTGTIDVCMNSGIFVVKDSIVCRYPYSSRFNYVLVSFPHLGSIAGWNAGSISDCINSNSLRIDYKTSSRYYSTGGAYSGFQYITFNFCPYFGGIVGWNAGTISNCSNIDNVLSIGLNKHKRGSVKVGGIAGRNTGMVTSCVNSGSLSENIRSDTLCFGGIVGWNEGQIRDCTNNDKNYFSETGTGTTDYNFYYGGISGWNDGTIRGCINSGELSSSHNFDFLDPGLSNSLYYGGIASWNKGRVIDCTNNGLIKNKGNAIVKEYRWGGIVGWNEGEIIKCTNNGGIPSSFAGGIAGRNTGIVKNCRNFGLLTKVDTKLDYSFFSAGGLVGSADSSSSMFNSYSATDSASYGVAKQGYGTVTNCYFDNDILKSSYPSAGLSMHTSDMQSDRFAWILNTTNGTTENSGVWSRDSEDYPIFADSLHKPIYKVIFDDSVETTNRYTNYNGFVVFPENPGPFDGKKFLGWFADDSVKVKETTVFSKDQTVYAVYCEPSSCPTEPSNAIAPNLPSPTWSITASGRNFQVHAAPVGKPYALFDLQGKVLAKGRIESPEMTLSAPRAGSYIVRVGERSVRMNAR